MRILLTGVAFLAPLTLSAQAAPEAVGSSLLLQAQQVLEAGRPFAATRLLAPLLAGPEGKSPGAVLLAARAAAGWEGWGTIVRLLTGQPWLDALANGEGRALLARARVERGQAPLEDARLAVADARGEGLGPRLITLARAFDRANEFDSAAVYYVKAQATLPTIADWLRLRAAGVLADSAARAALYQEITLPAALPRVRWTEALALDRSDNPRAAARLYDALGASAAAARLRLRAASGSVERAAVRRELAGLLTPRLSVDDARDVIALLDEAFPDLTAEEELLVARRTTSFDLSRSARGFSRATGGRTRLLSESDRLSYGSVLQRLGRYHEASVIFEGVHSRAAHLQAQYLRARGLLAAGSRKAGITLLREVSRSGGDRATAATAGYLVGDLLVDDGDDKAARLAYLEVAHRYPGTSHGARAAFQAALLAWVHGDQASAGKEFAALSERAGTTSEGVAALYWSGRVLLARGDTQAASARWRSILERFPNSYYTVPAADRLRVSAVREPAPELAAAPDSAVLAALDRAALLERLGLRVEARFEYDRLSRQAESAPGQMLATARAFSDRGLTARAYRLALRMPEAGQRLGFPLPDAQALMEAQRAGVDPLLAAALIRQESGFDPYARSRADARGLMQVLPSVGAGLAPAAGIADWDPALLYQSEINTRFGVVHLAETRKKYPLLAAALAAYNAGSGPTNRWLALPGAQDTDVFIERIQFVETRDYVRRVLRNLAVYRAFYPSVQ